MKKTFFTFFLFFSFLFSFFSCSTLMKEEFAKKKYYDFPLTKHKPSGIQEQLPVQLPREFIQNPSVQNKFISAHTTSTETNVNEPETFAGTDSKKKNFPPREEPVSFIPENKNGASSTFLQKQDGLKRMSQKIPSPSSVDPDVMLIILIILSFFLPPLAVYLKQNTISQWFWITLILCILSVGVLGLGYTPGGGLWFIAAIIALLVVFDVLD